MCLFDEINKNCYLLLYETELTNTDVKTITVKNKLLLMVIALADLALSFIKPLISVHS